MSGRCAVKPVTRHIGALGMVLLPFACPAVARSEPVTMVRGDGSLRLELNWQPRERGSQLSGYVYNETGSRIGRVTLLVEGLAPSGEVTLQSVTPVMGDVPGGDRTYVSATLPAASGYRVRVLGYDFTNCRD
jgi:hypothetical protein